MLSYCELYIAPLIYHIGFFINIWLDYLLRHICRALCIYYIIHVSDQVITAYADALEI